MNLGCGFVDIALLASNCITPGATLWKLDKKLSSLVEQFGVHFERVHNAKTHPIRTR